MRMVVCGAGTLGGTLVEHLARLGGHDLACIDHDTVEPRNLANQPYFARDVGRPKVKALTDLVYRITGGRLHGIEQRLTESNVDRLLAGFGLVVDAFDNRASRVLVKEWCRARAVPCLHVGLSRDGYAEILWNEFYRVPPDVAGDACQAPASRTLSLVAVAAAAEAVTAFLADGRRRAFTVTAADLHIGELKMV